MAKKWILLLPLPPQIALTIQITIKNWHTCVADVMPATGSQSIILVTRTVPQKVTSRIADTSARHVTAVALVVAAWAGTKPSIVIVAIIMARLGTTVTVGLIPGVHFSRIGAPFAGDLS